MKISRSIEAADGDRPRFGWRVVVAPDEEGMGVHYFSSACARDRFVACVTANLERYPFSTPAGSGESAAALLCLSVKGPSEVALEWGQDLLMEFLRQNFRGGDPESIAEKLFRLVRDLGPNAGGPAPGAAVVVVLERDEAALLAKCADHAVTLRGGDELSVRLREKLAAVAPATAPARRRRRVS